MSTIAALHVSFFAYFMVPSGVGCPTLRKLYATSISKRSLVHIVSLELLMLEERDMDFHPVS